MDPAELYRMVATGEYDKAIRVATIDQHDSPALYPILGIAYVLSGRTELAKRALKEATADHGSVDEYVRSLQLEAEMLLAVKERVPGTRLRELAENVVQLRPDALFANRMIGILKEARRDPSGALDHYQAVLAAYPESESSLFDCARMLIALKRGREAADFLSRARGGLRKLVYRIVLVVKWWPYRVLAGVLGALLILSPFTAYAFSAALISFGGLGIVAALRWRDGLVFGASLRVVLFALVLLFLRYVLGAAMTQ